MEAITFAEFIQYGIKSGAPLVNGVPWHFKYKGHAVTHENDSKYLIPTKVGVMEFTPDDVLISNESGSIYVRKHDDLTATYSAV